MCGGAIAYKLGLIQFDLGRVRKWLVEEIQSMRETRSELVVNHTEFLGRFLDEQAGNGLVCTHNSEKGLVTILREPRGGVAYRIDIDTQKLYISTAVLKRYLDKSFGSYSALRHDLRVSGALLNPGKRMVIGRGTYVATAQQTCWELDLSNPSLGRQTVRSLNKIETEAKLKLEAVRA